MILLLGSLCTISLMLNVLSIFYIGKIWGFLRDIDHPIGRTFKKYIGED